ncbi:MAG: ethylbenzene dehydrogenase-related protein [Thermaerobacterales bacterium]
MSTRMQLTLISLATLSAFVLSIIFASTGVVRDDPDRNIVIPEELVMDLKVKAAYNDTDVFWRFEWPAEDGDWYHDYLVYQGGEWVRYGRSQAGSDPYGTYEDRLTFFVDDGSVEYFEQYGGFITIVSDMRFMTLDVSPEEAQAHIGRDDVRKFLPDTRTNPHDWRTLKSEEELQALQEAGYFLDLWHWRAHRSNPIGFADDQHISWYRLGDDGRGAYTTNWDGDAATPAFMFDPAQTGQHAMRWDRVLNREYGQDDFYYLSEEIAVPFDPDHGWQEGDVIPRRLLREPTGSRGSIFANGIWQEGQWNLDLVRALDTGSPLDDKALQDKGIYNVAFAVHRSATGSRWHYISFPFSLGLDRPTADIVAGQFQGATPPWDEIEWTEMTLFYPGQITWDHVFSPAHAGYEAMKDKAHVRTAHSEETLSLYAVESEFRDEIKGQWIQTLAASVFFAAVVSLSVVRLAGRKDEEDELL